MNYQKYLNGIISVSFTDAYIAIGKEKIKIVSNCLNLWKAKEVNQFAIEYLHVINVEDILSKINRIVNENKALDINAINYNRKEFISLLSDIEELTEFYFNFDDTIKLVYATFLYSASNFTMAEIEKNRRSALMGLDIDYNNVYSN